MFTDENHIISYLINGKIEKSSLNENMVFLILCCLKLNFTDLHVILFLYIHTYIYQ